MAWAPDYITTADLKSFLGITDAADDAALAQAISAACRGADQYCNRQFGQVAYPETRYYTAQYDRRKCRWVVFHDDAMSVSGFAVQVAAGPIDVYDMKPVNAAAKSQPWTFLVVDPTSTNRPLGTEDEVAITALWGWSSVPTAVKQACLLQANRFFERRHSPYGVAGSPDVGSELRLLSRLDPDVAVALNPYRRWWAAA